ncbi:hypothetical protein BB558_002357 [Smittium angustum]|uniref:Dynamin-type G domain-containing protein n=1 Tax=Smittium angustum TaxID=133377 RepID=A0A2U1J976_SMIAN|nr:hypothetical protein BB558_002357 [Smittium angustum]
MDLRNHNFTEDQVRERIFATKSSRLYNYLLETKRYLQCVRGFNCSKWPVRYPLDNISSRFISEHGSNDSAASSSENSQDLQRIKRSSSFIYGLDHQQNYIDELSASSNLAVLRVDLRFWHGSNNDLMGSLEQSSISRLLEESILNTERHIDKLVLRVADNSSKILVTGDLNAGKSTFINALLRKDILPSDQQPCTMIFCEVLNASKNGNKEEIHAIKNISNYDVTNHSTYDIIEHSELEDTVFENEKMYQQVKIYTKDNRDSNDSLLHNGNVDISLIDSPGLNRDSIKTTQLFARQEEIDVVVFVVNAENHFTLSGQEFMASAGKEKAHIFVVVNRFDAIKRKEKCKAMIMDQISQLSPETFEEADNLVHFISARDMVSGSVKPSHEFEEMESRLKWWTLEQRFKSKLAPAQRYILKVLGDLAIISDENTSIASNIIKEINIALKSGMPLYEALLEMRKAMCKESETIIDSSCAKVKSHTEGHLSTTLSNLEASVFKVEWPGLFSAINYAEDVLSGMAIHLEHEVLECEKFGRSIITNAKKELMSLDKKRFEFENIDKEDNPSIRPLEATIIESDSEAMDSLTHIGGISNGLDTLGIHLSDFFDIDWSHLRVTGSLGFSAGSLVLFGSKMSNINSLFNLIKVSTNLSPRVFRGVLMLTACIMGAGSILYMFNETDAVIRRNIAKRIKSVLEEESFVGYHTDRLTTETNRAIRPFVWQFQSNFQRMVEAEERKRADHLRSRHLSQEAQMFFDDLKAKVNELAEKVYAVNANDSFK